MDRSPKYLQIPTTISCIVHRIAWQWRNNANILKVKYQEAGRRIFFSCPKNGKCPFSRNLGFDFFSESDNISVGCTLNIWGENANFLYPEPWC